MTAEKTEHFKTEVAKIGNYATLDWIGYYG